MKQLNIIIFSIFLFLSWLANAQSNPNVLTADEFENIAFNSITIKQIRGTNGDPTEVQNLFGTANEIIICDIPEVLCFTFYYNGYRMGFSSEISSEGNFTGLEVTNTAVALTVSGKTVRIGDNVADLGIRIKKNLQTNGAYGILFVPINDETVILAIDYNNSTGIITRIRFYVLT